MISFDVGCDWYRLTMIKFYAVVWFDKIWHGNTLWFRQIMIFSSLASHYRYHSISFYSHEPIWIMRALSILEAQQAAGAFMNFLHASQNDSMAMVTPSVDVSWKSISRSRKNAWGIGGKSLGKGRWTHVATRNNETWIGVVFLPEWIREGFSFKLQTCMAQSFVFFWCWVAKQLQVFDLAAHS